MRSFLMSAALLLATGCHEPVGNILVYEVDAESPADREKVNMSALIKAIDRRVNGGARRCEVRTLENGQIEIGIFGSNPVTMQRIENLVGCLGTLEFRILANQRDHKSLIDRALKEDGSCFKDDDGNLCAWWVPVTVGREESFTAYSEIATRTHESQGRKRTEILVVKDPFDVTGAYLTRAVPDVDQRGRPCVRFFLNAAGGSRFSGLTGNNLPDEVQNFSRKLGIILDGCLQSAPAIQSTISQQGEITGDFTMQEVQDFVDVFNAGSLPARVKKVGERKGGGSP
ncbi:MAG: hypothetical protein HUU20_06040 [Pirellulales bacterium]|nr:hypothetical protein [Pirellulales bacterium]